MTFLEFIRKNSLLVLIVIVAIGAGLLMMDYSDQGSAFSRDFRIQVNSTGYKDPDVYNMAESASGTIRSLISATYTNLQDRFDANDDDELSADEEAAMSAWIQEHPETQASIGRLQYILQTWSSGPCSHEEDNIAVNRAVLREEAKSLGIVPSKEQIDAFITGLPAFINTDGTFNQKLYQNLTGYYDGVANNPAEQSFRSVISDIIIWEAIGAMVTTDITYNTKAQAAMIDASMQSVKGKTAWLPADKVAAPAEPGEDEIKTYWEANKSRYKSTQRRIISLYTLTPGKDVTIDALMNTADTIMQDLSMANGSGLDTLLENAAANPENAEFSYKNEDGSTHVTFPLCTETEAPAELQAEIDHNGKSSSLAALAFNDIETAATVSAYEQASKNGTIDSLNSIQQMRGFFLTRDNKVVLIRVEAIEPPAELPYEQARDMALNDLKTERADNALNLAAEALFKEMSEALTAGEGLDAVFARATAAGAEVSDFGPSTLAISSDIPEGISTQALLTTASGKLCPLVVLAPKGARISAVVERTVPSDPQYTMAKLMYQLPMNNAELRNNIMLDWMSSAYIRYNVQLSDRVTTRGAR